MKNLKTGCHGNAEQKNLVTNTSKKPQQTAGRLRLVCCGENASNFRSFEYLNWKPIQNLKTERLCKGYTGHQTTTTRPAWVWPRSLTNKNQQTSVASTRTNNTENWTRQTLPPLHYNLISAIVKSTNLSKKQLITTWQTTRWQRRGQKQAGFRMKRVAHLNCFKYISSAPQRKQTWEENSEPVECRMHCKETFVRSQRSTENGQFMNILLSEMLKQCRETLTLANPTIEIITALKQLWGQTYIDMEQDKSQDDCFPVLYCKK